MQCETTSERRMLLFLMHSTARWRARKTGSKMAVAGLLFFAWKKKFQCAHAARAGNSSRRLDALGAAGLKNDYRCSRRIVGKLVT